MKTVRNRCEDGSIWRGIGHRSDAHLSWRDCLNTLNLEQSFAEKIALGGVDEGFSAICPAKHFGSMGDAASRVKELRRVLLPSDFVGSVRCHTLR